MEIRIRSGTGAGSWVFDVRVELLEADKPAAHDFRLAVKTQGDSM